MGNLFYELTESDLILAFSAFGPIQKLDMPKVLPPPSRVAYWSGRRLQTTRSASCCLGDTRDAWRRGGAGCVHWAAQGLLLHRVLQRGVCQHGPCHHAGRHAVRQVSLAHHLLHLPHLGTRSVRVATRLDSTLPYAAYSFVELACVAPTHPLIQRLSLLCPSSVSSLLLVSVFCLCVFLCVSPPFPPFLSPSLEEQAPAPIPSPLQGQHEQ